ncbi:MAG: aspartate aminotransferase family protein [Deltaproteobacteria bacterium]|nr:aspartate aminotransferase family protein [Deltaproteobacteria bacterium]
MRLEERGLPADEVLAELRRRHEGDLPTHGGRTWAYVYDSGWPGLDELLAAAHRTFSAVNGLDPTVFPSIVAMENDLVGAALELLSGPPGAVGTFTSGGTESCMLAVKAARDARPDVARPRMVVPTTVHPAFHKGAKYFGVEAAIVPVDPGTCRADPAAMAAAIDERTVLVVASAVSYAHGVCDPVPEIAAAALSRGVLCHVDGCIGAWLLGWWRRLGHAVPEFDFAVPGVTSLSVDLHKYAYAAKGASLLLFREAALRRASYFASAAWPGYVMINSTMQSTKSAGPLAAAWAALRHLGAAGHLELARRTFEAMRALCAGVEATSGLRVIGHPDAALVAIAASDEAVDVFVVADELRERGWYVQPQLAFGTMPRNLHLTVTAASLPRVEPLLADLRASVAAARVAPSARPDPGLVAAAQTIDPGALTPEEFARLLAFAGLDPSALAAGTPARMAGINHILEAVTPRLRERLLMEFLGLIYTTGR